MEGRRCIKISLVIHTIVKDGLVVGSDTRTTCQGDKGEVRYKDTTVKIFPFPNRIVVTHTGDANVTDTLSVAEFLTKFRKKCGNKITITELPTKLLNAYVSETGNRQRNTEFKVAGYDTENLSEGRVYTVKCQDRTIVLSKRPFEYGASLGGTVDVAYAMLNGVSFSTLSLEEAIDLTKTVIETNISVFKYRANQIIGGNAELYVIDRINEKSGWFKAGEIIPDNLAPDDGLEKYLEQKEKRMLKKLRQNKK